MRKRILMGTTLALLVIGLLLLDGYLATLPPPAWSLTGTSVNPGAWLFNGLLCTTVVLVLTVLATHELVHLARSRGYHPFGRTAQFFAAFLVLGPYVSFSLQDVVGGYDESWALLWMAIALGWVFMLQAIIHKTTNTMENIATTMFIIFYAGGLAGFMTKLRMEVGGATGVAVLLFSMFLVKITDTGAYFIGKSFGRHKFVPWLSPKKTWEGFFGGMGTCIVCALALGHWLHTADLIQFDQRVMPYPLALGLLGLMLGLVSVAGDLCASLLKRDAAVKDSGQALPGLGGIVDVVDSPLLAAPVAWVFWTRMFHLV